jgi:ubiquinone/menaquinone biosynthesis C-methylase UbiE
VFWKICRAEGKPIAGISCLSRDTSEVPVDDSRRLILDQFTRQAVPFSEMHARDDAEIHRLLIETAGIGSEDEGLDVACGPGLVACEVARLARHVTGVDLTRAMIEQAEARQRSLGLTNLSRHNMFGLADSGNPS